MGARLNPILKRIRILIVRVRQDATLHSFFGSTGMQLLLTAPEFLRSRRFQANVPPAPQTLLLLERRPVLFNVNVLYHRLVVHQESSQRRKSQPLLYEEHISYFRWITFLNG